MEKQRSIERGNSATICLQPPRGEEAEEPRVPPVGGRKALHSVTHKASAGDFSSGLDCSEARQRSAGGLLQSPPGPSANEGRRRVEHGGAPDAKRCPEA